jgi:hypothetical protein
MAIRAARRASGFGGGFRLYVLAKGLDSQGRGSVSRDELRAYLLSLGASPRQWQRWITEARNNDLVRDWQRKTGEWMLALPSTGAAAHAMGCESVGNRRATMAAAGLIGPGWKARTWAAYDATHNGRPISRERMQKILNVPISTQRYRDRQAGVTRQRNYARLNYRADSLAMLKEFSRHKRLYVRYDGYIGSRKPDSRFTEIAVRAGKGRARKANATLHRMQRSDGLSPMRQAFSQDVTPEIPAKEESVNARLFNYTHSQAQATARKLAQADVPRPPDVYELSHVSKNGSGAQIWQAC